MASVRAILLTEPLYPTTIAARREREQTPTTTKTPISGCIELALYASRMMGNFTQNPKIGQFAQQMTGAGDKFDDAAAKYAAAVKQIILARVDVKYINYIADDGIRMAQRRAELADGKTFGPIAGKLFPEGTTPITKPFGAGQVKQMLDLESRYQALEGTWADAKKEGAIIADLRKQYEAALAGRDKAKQTARDLRITRDIVKEGFLNAYAQIAAGIKGEYPRDKKMQDLFFDELEVSEDETEAPAAGEPSPPAGVPGAPPGG